MSARTAAPFVALILATPVLAHAAASGSCHYQDQTFSAADAVIYQRPDPFEEGKKEIHVAFASVKLDAAALAAAEDADSAVNDAVWNVHGAGLVRLTLGEGGVTGIYAYLPPGTNVSQSGSAFGELKLARNDARGAAGHFTLKNPPEELSCELKFDLAYVAPAAKPAGKPIAAGGGEAGKVLQANLAAMQKGDVDAMLATVSKDQAGQMRAQRQDKDFPAMLEMMKAFAPKRLTVTGGEDFGDRADLTLEGVDQSGGKSKGVAHMVKENGRWKVQKTQMQSGG